MEAFHIIAPVAIGIVLTFLSYFDERLLEWKLQPYLESRFNAEAAETITHIAIGSASLVIFLANSLAFMVNMLLAFTLYEVIWLKAAVTIMIIICMMLLVYVLAVLLVREEIVDIIEHKFGRFYVSGWMRLAQILFNVIAIAMLGAGLGLSQYLHAGACGHS